MTEERKCRQDTAAGRRWLALWSVLLAGAAVVLHCIAAVMFRSGNDTGQMLVYAAVVVAVGAIVCGGHAVRRGRQGNIRAWVGCVVGVLCLIAVIPLLSFQQKCHKSIIRACIANMRNLDSALSQAMIEIPNLAENYRISSDVSSRFLRNPTTICCPCMPGVPYLVYPTRRYGDSVVCPAKTRSPKKYSAHVLCGASSNIRDVAREGLLMCFAAIPAACAFFCGMIVCYSACVTGSKRHLAWFGCVMGGLCVLAGLLLLYWRISSSNTHLCHRQVCYENRQVVEWAWIDGRYARHAVALTWTNVAMIPSPYFTNQNAVCCPAAPRVPYTIAVSGGSIRVECPAEKMDPKKYGDHKSW